MNVLMQIVLIGAICSLRAESMGLNAGDVAVTVVHIDGKKHLKCMDTGVFRNPVVKWYDIEDKDLSEHGTRNLTVLGDGRVIVESVLELDAETNKQYVCQVKKGRLKRSARAVISEKTNVVALLYDKVTLTCSFTFIQKPEGLTVVWEKQDKDGERLLIHKSKDGQDNLADQHINYAGRTNLSLEFSLGKADLILQNVTFNDEGTYSCRAANGKDQGDKEVELTISGLNVTVTVVHIDEKKHLKCIATGVFRNPWVKWYDIQGKDLSEHGTWNLTVLGDGRKMVESVLELDAETNKHYFCQVKEERLKRSARAVISDGKPVIVP